MGRPGKKAQRLNITSGSLSLFDVMAPEVSRETVTLSDDFDATRPEQSYGELVTLAHRKRYGQFFTPEPIANLMVVWVLKSEPVTLLDPAVGPGVFLRAVRKISPTVHCVGIDVDSVALAAGRLALGGTRVDLIQNDFLTWESDRAFDAIVANPPYLRHHDIHYVIDIFAEVGHRNGATLSKLSNIYVLFIMEICRRLNPGGRAAVIVPSEWTNANFGMPLKKYLLENDYLSALVYFSNLSEQFDDALTTASILLIEKPKRGILKRESFDSYFVEKSASIDDLSDAVVGGNNAVTGIMYQAFSCSDMLNLEKWDKALRDGLAEQRSGFAPLSTLVKSRRGIATGANDFFHLSEAAVNQTHLQRCNVKRCIGRAEDVAGLIFTQEDFEKIRAKGSRVWLLSFEGSPNEDEQKYLQVGVEKRLNERFLLASRRPWYSMERRPPAPIWAAVFGRKSLRFIYNDADISNLTTFHCIYPASDEPLFCRALVACLNSRLVQAMAEHQRRVYGGGLVKFEPKDLLDIQIPMLEKTRRSVLVKLSEALDKIDAALRKHREVPTALAEELDALVVEAGLATF